MTTKFLVYTGMSHYLQFITVQKVKVHFTIQNSRKITAIQMTSRPFDSTTGQVFTDKLFWFRCFTQKYMKDIWINTKILSPIECIDIH